MKPRQIKKNSKTGMDLLIRLFPISFDSKMFRLFNVYYLRNKTKRQLWYVIKDKDGEYIPTIEQYEALFTLCIFKDCDPAITKPSLLIKECRQLAKAGVKFR